MGCPGGPHIAITIFLASIVLQGSGELFIVQHSVDDESHTAKMTCVSEADDAALIWNYDNSMGNVRAMTKFESFERVKSNGYVIGTLDSGPCFVGWRRKSRGWRQVNSMINSMAPVYDYRWEEKREVKKRKVERTIANFAWITFIVTLKTAKIQESIRERVIPLSAVGDGLLKESGSAEVYRVFSGFKESTIGSQEVWNQWDVESNTVVFSARESTRVTVAICEQKKMTQGSCIWILIGSRNAEESKILTCKEGKPDNSPTGGEHCNLTYTGKPFVTKGLDIYEWHTFRIEWGVRENILRVFQDFDETFFLQGAVGTRLNRRYDYTVDGDPGTRIRFHDYKYWETTRGDAVISTESFQTGNNELFFDLTFGLCSDCSINIDLVDEKMQRTVINAPTIFGKTGSTTNGSLTWQTQRLKLSIDRAQRDNRLSLRIRTILNYDRSTKGHWAIDRVRLGRPLGTMRASTLTLRKLDRNYRPQIVCQKISRKGADAISLSYVEEHQNYTDDLEQMLDIWRIVCGSSCEGLGKGSMICNSKNCMCDRGYRRGGCTQPCASGSYGYDCRDKCGSCKDKKCNKVTGHCEYGCESVEFKSPFCQRDPTVPRIDQLKAKQSDTSDTTIILEWELSPPNIEMKVEIEVKLLSCGEPETIAAIPPITASSPFPFSVRRLRPYARYEVTMTPKGVGLPKKTEFTTKESDTPTSLVRSLRFYPTPNRIKWKKPVDCNTITGPTEYTKLVIAYSNGSKVGEGLSGAHRNYYDLEPLRLAPFTTYQVSAYVSRDSKGLRYNATANRTIFFTTLPAAPPEVTNLEVYDADPDKNTISLRWLPPKPARGVLKTYHISIGTTSNTTRGADDGDKTGCEEKYFCYDGVEVPSSAGRKKTWIKVYAENQGVNKFGKPASILFNGTSYFNVSSHPRNVTVTPKGQGIIELRWEHPLVSYTKLKRFDIRAKVVESEKGKPVGKIIFFVHNVTKEQSYYAKTLVLPTSTSFEIFVTAVNVNDLSSSAATANASTQQALAFADGEEIQVERNKGNEAAIELEVPRVQGATDNTWVNVTVKGRVTCLKNNSEASSTEEWNVASHRTNGKDRKHITIGDYPAKGVTPNCTLHLGETYEVMIVVKDRSSNVSISKTSRLITLGEARGGGFNAAWLIILLVVLAIILLAVFLIRRRKTKRSRAPLQVSYGEVLSSRQENRRMEDEEENLMYGTTNCQSSTPPLDPQNREAFSHVYAVPFVPKSSSVSMMCFEEYAKEITSSGLMATQYTTFPRGLTKPCDYGRLPQNMPKNRNKNLIAYDQTRVVLDKNHDDPYSDYINASYIQGYGEPEAYIATQGPKANTVNDFWRMIWQKRVPVICMLTNVMEDGEKVCEEYWPPIGSKLKYGDVVVSNMEHQVFADYTNRTFEISYRGETRKLTHLHYTGWPSRGVPMYSQSLVAYLKKLVETLGGRGPVVVHCSGGDGRTGTVILCDMCVRRGIGEGDIDVPRVAKLMCESRANMIGSPQQFLLAHIVIAESIMSISTQVPCTDVLPERIKTLRRHLPSHIQKLNESVWQERALQSFASSDSPVSGLSSNNRLPELIPVGLDVVNHRRNTGFIGNDNNHIGAINVNGVREKNQNLTAQLPSSTSLPDFWRFVAEQNIELIVVLQPPEPGNPIFCDFMPGESILVPVPYIQIVTKTSYSEEGIFTVAKLILTDSSEETPRSQLVTVLTCSGWGGDGKPPPASDLVSLWQASENIPRKGGLSLVLCRNGVTACGLYLAMSFLLERMAVDRECDVISAVRTVRRSRPEFVQSLEQFDYLYDTALNYAQCFQTYANFS